MPAYLIIVNQPGCLPESDPSAVETVEEAREAALDELTKTADFCGAQDGETLEAVIPDFADAARQLEASGGVIGPLPDGYVIEVRPVSMDELAKLAGLDLARDPRAWSMADVIDAYNNQES